MADNKIACYFHPTEVVLIDDQLDYLDSIILQMDRSIIVKPFSNPFKAVDFLKAQPRADRLAKKLLISLKDRENLGDLEQDNISCSYTGINVFDIHKMIYQADRFSRIIVVIIDYAIPGMDGIEISKALKDMPFKFILLTGKALPETVIKAFNDGRIHAFVNKKDTNFQAELNKIIFKLQRLQFQEFSESVIDNLAVSPISCLGDQIFIKFFYDFCAKNNITEYYLINESGSFLVIDNKGILSILAVKGEREMQEYAEVAMDCGLSQHIITDFASRKKLLFLFSESDEYNVPIESWGNYMYPASKLKGASGTYYYAHIQNIKKYDINLNNVVTYQSYFAKT